MESSLPVTHRFFIRQLMGGTVTCTSTQEQRMVTYNVCRCSTMSLLFNIRNSCRCTPGLGFHLEHFTNLNTCTEAHH